MRSRRSPPPVATGPRDDIRTLKTLLPYIWPAGAPALRARVVVSALLLIAAKLVTVAVPVILKYAVDALTAAPPKALGTGATVPVGFLVAYGAARLLSTTFKELQGAIFVHVAQHAVRDAGLRTFRHLHHLALRFHLERQTGGLSRIVERGTRAIEVILRMVLFNIAPVILEVALVAAVLWSLFDFRFVLLTGATVVVYAAWTLVVTEWRTQYRRQMNETDNRAHTKAVDSLINYETVKYFGNEEHEARRFDSALADYERAAVRTRTSLSLLNTGQGAIIATGVTVAMVMAGSGVKDGTMTIGDFVLVNTYLLQLYLPLNFLGSVYREIKHSLTDMEHMFALLSEDPEIEDAPDAEPVRIDGGELVFEEVSFHYDPRRSVLRDVSFRIPAGHTVALVGPSGAGKSTISKLLFRFYDVTGGRILIDGQDLRDVTQASLRAAIGIVPQDTVLFNDTIYYNVAYGRPDATKEEVEEAAKLASIHDFVTGLPDGYGTLVGERGLKLSGGEKQRVAIARTILKGPAILLFDEATSALDSQTEKDIQQSLDAVSADRTTLIIAHRLSTVIHADEILVLDEGRIAERGSHVELLTQGGRYADMWARQQEADRARDLLGGPKETPDAAQ